MFGLNIIKTSELKALKSLENEVKGYYGETDGFVNQYLQIIAPQLKGLEMGQLARFSRLEIKNAYETLAPVMGVINYIADNVGEVAKYLELYDIKKGDYVDTHPILDLLNKPNDRFTRRKFLTAWAINKLLFGDALVYAPKKAGKDRTPKEMYIIPGQRVEIDRGGITAPFKGIKLTGTSGKDEILLEGNCFQSFDYNLDDTSFYGTSKIVAAAVYLTVIDRAMQRQATTLKNGGPANVITPSAHAAAPALPQQVDDIEQKTNAQKNANKNIAMRTAIEVHKLGDNPADLSILSSHKDAINVLCFVYKLPVDIYLGQSKYENAKEAKKTIYEQLAIPLCNEFAEDLVHYLGLSDQFELTVDTDKIEVLKKNRGETLDDLAKMHATLNELREANNYERIDEDWADKPIMPLGVQFGNEASDFDINE